MAQSQVPMRVFVALSGGVDSSVAALLLKKQGYDVTGVFMRCYNVDGCAERDAEDARRVAQKLGIPFYVWDFEDEYKKRVVDYMVDGYRRGITPNPDVMCNKEIKFGLFFDKAMEVGADYVATGHYVRREPQFSIINDQFSNNVEPAENFEIENSLKNENCKLKIAKDANKDQSYFLWTLTPDKLRRCLFPIGDYLKSEVRQMAREAGLPTAEKKDSQGICFLGQVKLEDFLKQYIPEKSGDVLLTTSASTHSTGSGRASSEYKKIGEHRGAQFYTLGQREGVGNVKHQKGMHSHAPLYVAEKDVLANIVVVAKGSDNPALYRKNIQLTGVNFFDPSHSNVLENIRMRIFGLKVLARVRYRQPLAQARLVKNAKLKDEGYELVFDKPVKFVAPGQSAVIYSAESKGMPAGKQVLGGGVIKEAT